MARKTKEQSAAENAADAAIAKSQQKIELTDEEKSVIRDAILTDGIVEKGGARAVVALVQYRAKRDGRKSTAITSADVADAADAVASYIRGLGRAVPARVESVWKSRARQKLGLAKAGRGGRPPSTGGQAGQTGQAGNDELAQLFAPVLAALRGHRPLLMEGLRNIALVCSEIVAENSADDVRIRVERVNRK